MCWPPNTGSDLFLDVIYHLLPESLHPKLLFGQFTKSSELEKNWTGGKREEVIELAKLESY